MSMWASIRAPLCPRSSGRESVQVIPNVGAIGADVTELPGHGATSEQISMLHTRYNIAVQLSVDREVLEVACGTGVGLGCLADRARRVVGADLDERNVDFAARHYGKRVEVLQLDAQALPFPDRSFDLIVLLDSIYWLPKPENFLAEARRVLRNNGTLYISTSNPERLDFNRCPYASRYFTAGELKSFLENSGFIADVSVAFPIIAGGLKQRILAILQIVAAKLHLIPKKANLKVILKRLFFGKLQTFPKELVLDQRLCQELAPVENTVSVSDYKILYAIACKLG